MWEMAFESLIESKVSSSVGRLHFLRKYVSGGAKECLEGIQPSSPRAYEDARESLKERYGAPFDVYQAYRDMLRIGRRLGTMM